MQCVFFVGALHFGADTRRLLPTMAMPFFISDLMFHVLNDVLANLEPSTTIE